MKILQIINNLSSGGAERLLVNWLPFLKEKKCEVTLLQLSDRNSKPEYIQMLQNSGVKVVTVSKTSVYNPLLFFKLYAFFKKNTFDIVHFHLFPAMYFGGLLKMVKASSAPFIFTEHNISNKRIDHFFLRQIDAFIYRFYTKIIAISPAIASKFRQVIPLENKIEIIRNGVNVASFSEIKPYCKIDFLKECKLPENAFLLTMPARFDKQKDHKTLIKSLAYLPENVCVLLVGTFCQNGKKLAEWVQEKGFSHRVRFLGFRTDCLQIMKTSDMVVLSSFNEGMSGVACEAMALEVPFLGSDVQGINDVVPSNHFLFSVENEKELAQKVQQILTDTQLSEKIKTEGKEQIEKFDILLMVEKHWQLYLKLKNG